MSGIKENIILVGGGGHCKACIDVIQLEDKFIIAGIVDLKEKLNQQIMNYTVIATDEQLPELARQYKYFLVTIGQINNPLKRKRIYESLKKLGGNFPVIVSPFAYVSKTAAVDEGTIIMHKAFVGSNTSIGSNTIINTNAVVEHDTQIGSHCHIATSATINGQCVIKESTFIGSGVVIANNVEIEKNVVIGAGSLVLKSIHESGVYIGSPAVKIN